MSEGKPSGADQSTSNGGGGGGGKRGGDGTRKEDFSSAWELVQESDLDLPGGSRPRFGVDPESVVLDGLKVRAERMADPFTFSYIWMPGISGPPKEIDWIPLSVTEISYADHIQCHGIKDSSTLEGLYSLGCNSRLQALILVNSSNNYQVERDVLPASVQARWLIPVLLVTSSVGESLLELKKLKDLYVKVELESSKDQGSMEGSYRALSPSGSSGGTLRRARAVVKSEKDLSHAVERLLFDRSQGAASASEDEGLFQVVMSELHTYELQYLQGETSVVSTPLLHMLTNRCQETFERDFPFYLILAYRTSDNSAYKVEAQMAFVEACVKQFETLPSQCVASTLGNFLDREDFEFYMTLPRTTDHRSSAFFTFQNALYKLMKDRKRSVPYRIYPRMLWITAYLKVYTKNQQLTGGDAKHRWHTSFLEDCHLYTLDSPNIEGVKRAISLGDQLELPAKFRFGAKLIGDLLAPASAVRPFQNLKIAVSSLGRRHFTFEIDFTKHVVTRLLDQCKKYQKENRELFMKSVNPENSSFAAITGGLVLLDAMIDVITAKSWAMEQFNAHFHDWLMFFMDMINFDHRPQNAVKELMSPGKYQVVANYATFIEEQIIVKTRQRMFDMTPEKFFPLYNAFMFWPDKVLEDYISGYAIPANVRICDPAWALLFTSVAKRFPGASSQQILFKLVNTIGSQYIKENRPTEFIVDLLKLGVPLVFAVQCDRHGTPLLPDKLEASKFVADVQEFIKKTRVKLKLLAKMKEILSCVTEGHNGFQEKVLSAVCKECIPSAEDLKGATAKSEVTIAIRVTATVLKDNFSWVNKSLSLKQKFCLNFIVSCSAKIPVSSSSSDWAQQYSTAISQLGYVHHKYMSSAKVVRTFEDRLPDEITESTPKLSLEYFQWVQKIHRTLATWRDSLEDQSANYSVIGSYVSNHVHIQGIARELCAGSLLVARQDAVAVSQNYVQMFEELNQLLLKYIPDDHGAGWCSLLSVLGDLRTELPRTVDAALRLKVVFPNEIPTKAASGELLPYTPALSSQGKFSPPNPNTHLYLTKEMSLASLRVLVSDLRNILEPIGQHINVLVYFQLKPSKMFSSYLKKSLHEVQAGESTLEDATGVSIPILEKALDHTKYVLERVLQGKATYGEIVPEGSMELQQLDIEMEFSKLVSCPEVSNYGTSGFRGVKDLIKLFRLTTTIETICTVCEQYNLVECLKDPRVESLKRLSHCLNDTQEYLQLTSADASRMWLEALENLCIKDEAHLYCLKLFSAIAQSVEFYQLLKEKQCTGPTDEADTGPTGEARFNSQMGFLTQQLQHEEYNDMVLNHLIAAFTFMLPFTDNSIDFQTLMKTIVKLDVRSGVRKLETVRKNIQLIRLWLLRAESDPMENLYKDLEQLFQTGSFRLFPDQCGSLKMELQYQYRSSSVKQRAVSEQPGGSPTSSIPFAEVVRFRETWNIDQINDFVHQLSFFDANKEEETMVHHFQHVNEMAFRLFNVYKLLRELAHPVYTKKRFLFLPCSTALELAERRVADVEEELADWNDKVEELHSSYKWLLFFRVPKLRNLNEILMEYRTLSAEKAADPQYLLKIVGEIGFLFQNNAATRTALGQIVKQAVHTMEMSEETGDSPMDTVGSFLNTLFSISTPSCRLPSRDRVEHIQRANSVNADQVDAAVHTLHSAPGYTHSQLVRLVLGIYGGPPEAVDVFHCQLTTTESELRLFMKRVTQHLGRSYLILEVNLLPYHLQEYLLKLFLDSKHQLEHKRREDRTTLHFVETTPSVFREVPWVRLEEHKSDGPPLVFSEARKLCMQTVKPNGTSDFSVELVYGPPGCGKTHYITQQLALSDKPSVTVAVNEAFSISNAIGKLCSLPSNVEDCAVFFNFTILLPEGFENTRDQEQCKQLVEQIGWFFFELLVLGYVEDQVTGKSFQFPVGMGWKVYVEIPSKEVKTNIQECFEGFIEEVVVLGLLGDPHQVDASTEYTVDADVHLVCKYLKVYKENRINVMYREGGPLVKFSLDPDLPPEECLSLLSTFMPDYVRKNKITQRLFIQYMKRRCHFLDNLTAFNYNRGAGIGEYKGKPLNLKRLGSTLMETMLKEVAVFCDPNIRETWTQEAHEQLIYGRQSLNLITVLPDAIPEDEKEKYGRLGVKIPSLNDLASRAELMKYLSQALNVPLTADGRLSPLDDEKYVLTLDYTLKMLNVHERREGGIPAIIQGETGVGKTALIKMLSQLWNLSLRVRWNRQCGHILDQIIIKVEGLALSPEAVESPVYNRCVVTVCNLNDNNDVEEAELEEIANLPDEKEGFFYNVLRGLLEDLEGDPIFAVLDFRVEPGKNRQKTLATAFKAMREGAVPLSKAVAHLLHIIFTAQVKGAFYKINVHAALKPSDIKKTFEQVISQAREMQELYVTCDQSKRSWHGLNAPTVTVYLDEINTASCLGLFKEIIVDRTIDGDPIPENVFFIASCNPHRGDSLAVHGQSTLSRSTKGTTDGQTFSSESWLKGTYYVRRLHPTLQFLMWDYGALDESQEHAYINAKLAMLNSNMDEADVASLAERIVESQVKMRQYAFDQLKRCKYTDEMAKLCAKSSVSQRDIQRVFTFYEWLRRTYERMNPYDESIEMQHRRAILVSLAIVYFMRLGAKHRKEYKQFLDNTDRLGYEITFTKAFEDELKWYVEKVDLPPGIAKTEALMENILATIVCTMTNTPLIIVGEPGSSKTLSFNIVVANLKGRESKVKDFRQTDFFRSLDPHFYQCSRRTTSTDVERIFERAINRQRILVNVQVPVNCVVFMDEAGLPEDSGESLKILHHYLDRQEVSFVAISNHVLDAAKSNRAVTVFRPEAANSELKTLATECMVSPGEKVPEKLIQQFCSAYSKVLKDSSFKGMFGLRDFVHFITYLRRHRRVDDHQAIFEGLERNFNGTDSFGHLCDIFFSSFKTPLSELPIVKRSVLNILESSLKELTCSRPPGTISVGLKDRSTRPVRDDVHNSIHNEVRYKLIIDPSEDDSLVRLLFTQGVLKRKNTRVYVCSDFPEDSHLRVNTITQIRHSVSAGHTVLMCETDEIHESFYDLFNQHFRSIDDPKQGTRYYTNITIGSHSKPCRVHPDFQCLVVIKKSDVENTPAPFLNRFEKYCLSHKVLLDDALTSLKDAVCLRLLLEVAKSKVADLIKCVKPKNLYGYRYTQDSQDTLDSLMLTFLPPRGYKYEPVITQRLSDERRAEDNKILVLQTLLNALRENAGFRIPHCAAKELKEEADHIFQVVDGDRDFNNIVTHLSKDDIIPIVGEALHVLHYSAGPKDPEPPSEIHVDSCMVLAVLLQWLVRYMSKKILQLLTPEALVVHCKEIPSPYLKHYLQVQEHFSLRGLVEKHLDHLELNEWNATVCATKLLCYTRSSPIVRQLPAEFPIPSMSVTDTLFDRGICALAEYVYSELDYLMLCKITLGHSQIKLERLLFNFISSDKRLLLLVVNMQEITIKMVNHLRILIEEAERQNEGRQKLFVILLHFPPVKFFDPCYPSLFLQGWDHHYLDSIAHGTLTQGGVSAVVDIKFWFDQCVNPDSLACYEDRMLNTLETLVSEAVPMVASRVSVILTEPDTCSNVQWSEVLQTTLIAKGVGKVLASKFRAYWEPRTMVKELKRVTTFMYNHESTLNITDSIQSVFRSLFFDFLVYMVVMMNKDSSMQVLLKDDCSEEVERLYRDLLRALPIPHLTHLKILSTSLQLEHYSKEQSYSPRFPFFKQVCETIDNAIDESKEEVNEVIWASIRGESEAAAEENDASIALARHSRKTKQQMQEEEHFRVLMNKMESKKKKTCLMVAVKAMDEYHVLFERYIDDFIHRKLHLGSLGDYETSLTRRLLRSYTGDLQSKGSNSVLAHLARLHVRFHVRKLNLTRVTQILKQFARLQVLQDKFTPISPQESAFDFSTPPSPSCEVPQGIIVDYIFTFVRKSCSKVPLQRTQRLNLFFRSYQDLVHVPGVVESSLSNLLPEVEARLTVIHTTYLVMKYCASESAEQGYLVFKELCSKCFERQPQPFPNLALVVSVTFETLKNKLYTECGEQSFDTRSFMEGLFRLFFSQYQSCFKEEDCRWFLEQANQHTSYVSQDHDDSPKSPGSTDPLHACGTEGIFKLYLSRILKESDVERGNNILRLHNPKMRRMVGQVLIAHGEMQIIGPYIPLFYQLDGQPSIDGSENGLMQQRLAHLYFVTVLEHLTSKNHGASHLVRLANKTTEWCNDVSVTAEEKVLLHIEKQAVIQVLIQQIATFFNPQSTRRLRDLYNARLVHGVNSLLDDPLTGGSATAISGHGLVLALHLQRQLHSTDQLLKLLREDDSSLVESIHCMKPLQPLVKRRLAQSFCHLFPFIGREAEMSEVWHLYHKVFEAMFDILKRNNADNLKKLVQECCVTNTDDPLKLTMETGSTALCKKAAFKMVLWLCAYYNIFGIPDHQSRDLAKSIGEHLNEYMEPEVIFLLQAFVCPDVYMTRTPERSTGSESAEKRFSLSDSLRVLPMRMDSFDLSEPIFQLFTQSGEDPSDRSLCHSIANMIAVVLALEPRSNHLWYHLFEVDKLENTFMTGFLYNRKVSRDCPYECGVQLSPEGRYGRPDYLPRAEQGPLSLHSLYLVLWANFAASCLSLITQPYRLMISGSIMSSDCQSGTFCLAQLRNVWQHMRTNMKLSLEEQSFFIMSSMYNLLNVCIREPDLVGKGIFETVQDLNNYEQMWHERVFTPSFTNLRTKVASCGKYSEHPLLSNLSCLASHYPNIATVEDFLQGVLASPSTGDKDVLSQFALRYPHLQAGGALLPDLIHLYWWIHTELAHRVTRQYAVKHTIAEVVSKADKYTGIELSQLYERVRAGYNTYVRAVGHQIGAATEAAVPRKGTVYQIDDGVNLIHFLSEREGEGGSDLLYTVIADIIAHHNEFLKVIEGAVDKTGDKVFPDEVNQDMCFVGRLEKTHGCDEHMQLVRSHYLQPGERLNPSIAVQEYPFDFERLQKDIITSFLSGKPVIVIDNLRKPFKFLLQRRNTLTLGVTEIDIDVLSEYIKDSPEFEIPLEEDFERGLECEFHSADYHTLLQIAFGLRTATEHLIKHLNTKDASGPMVGLQSMRLPDFLVKVYHTEVDRKDVLEEIGIPSLSRNRMACLENIGLPYLYSTLELFIQWIKDGTYDFHRLPIAMKRHLNEEDKQILEEVVNSQHYADSPAALLKDLQSLGEALMLSESHLSKSVAQNLTNPIMKFLQRFDFYGVEELLSKLIPDTVQCQHYVALRIEIRRLMSDLQGKVPTRSDSQLDIWKEYSPELWTESHLKHLRDNAIPFDYIYGNDEFVYDLELGLYGFQQQPLVVEGDQMYFIDEEKPPTKVTQPSPDIPSRQPYIPPKEVFIFTDAQLKEKAQTLTVGDVSEYLKSPMLNLEEYVELFKSNDVDGDLLWTISEVGTADDDLKDLGVSHGFHRRKIVGKFKAYLRELLGEPMTA